MTRSQKELSVYLSQEDHRRMLEDDTYLSGTPEDVQRLLKKMALAQCPREDIIKVRRKYHPLLHDREAKLMNQFGLNYDDHVITRTFHGALLINGYSIPQWRMMVDDDYFPNYKTVKREMIDLGKKGDDTAVQILNMKYCTLLADRDEQILAAHDIPLDTTYSVLTTRVIDGIPFNLWHLLYDPAYIPSRQILVSQLHFLRKSGKDKEAKIIEDKYRTQLDPGGTQITETDIQEAQDFFKHFLD